MGPDVSVGKSCIFSTTPSRIKKREQRGKEKKIGSRKKYKVKQSSPCKRPWRLVGL
jgi:hypothetical protein